MSFRRRDLAWFALLLLDFAVLASMTAWVVRRPARAAVPARTPPAVPTIAVSAVPVVPVPARSAAAGDNRLRGGPKFVTCGTVDALGNAWVGAEDQGLWSYQSGDNWLTYGTAEGLADADVTAVACDAAGRVWVGHADHGLSVYNGQEWRTYDRFAGPAGPHVFCLAAGAHDVWIGTDAGLARYSLAGDAWTAYDRSTGLPGAAVTSVAVDSAGRVFAGLDSGGLGIATPADGYAAWTHVSGPDDLPIVASGPGLPSPLVNAVLVARPDDAVYVGTCHGLARSVDHGVTWAYVRGRNWPQLSKGRYDGVPAGFAGTPAGPLLEDWVSALAQDAAGVLWVGYREAGFQAFPDLAAKADYAGKGRVTALVPPAADGPFLVGTYGDGLTQCGTTYAGPVAAAPAAATVATFPTPAPPATAAALDALRAKVLALPPGRDGVDFLGDDWGTQGDWCGRYGRRTAMLLGYHDIKATAGYDVGLGVGPYRTASPRWYWDHPGHDHRGQLNPWNGVRAACEFNDESYDANAHPRWQQGPDIYLAVTVPAGVHRLSFYWYNHDGHGGRSNFCRDFPVDLRRPDSPAGDDDGTPEPYDGGRRLDREHTVAAERAPPLARTRVSRYWRPLHKQFLTRGAGTYYVRVDRNGSSNTKVNGVFIDRLDGPAEYDPAYPHPPAGKDYTAEAGTKGAAARLWAALDAAVGRQGYAAVAGRGRNAAYYAAAAAGVDPDTLARWRYQMPLWLADDHAQFDRYATSIPPAKADQ